MRKNIPWALCWMAVGFMGGALVLALFKADNIVGYLNEKGAAVTAAFTVVLGFSTVGLWQATYRLWQTAERQIDAAREALDLTRTNNQHQLRAYLTVDTFTSPIALLDAEGWLQVKFRVRNEGQTPARKIVISYGSELVPPDSGPVPRDYRMTGGNYHLVPGRSLLSEIYVQVPPDDDNWARLRSRQLHFHFFGQVEYEDIFGQKRVTEFYETTGAGADDEKMGIRRLGAVETDLVFS